jgi:putative transposase
MRYNFIRAEKALYPIHLLCKVFAVSPSGYYAWRNRSMSKRQRDDLILLAHILTIHKNSFMDYGCERMAEELRKLGFVVSERKVARLMKDNNVRVIRTHKFNCTTDSNHNHAVATNLLERDFWATGPNQK